MSRRSDEPKKITWEFIFQDFKQRYPNLGKTVYDFRPHSYATILLFFPDRVHVTYNYDTKTLERIYDIV